MFARVWAVEAASSGKQAFLSIFSNLDSQYQDKQDRSKIKNGRNCKYLLFKLNFESKFRAKF